MQKIKVGFGFPGEQWCKFQQDPKTCQEEESSALLSYLFSWCIKI
jgi:hypothetical protein